MPLASVLLPVCVCTDAKVSFLCLFMEKKGTSFFCLFMEKKRTSLSLIHFLLFVTPLSFVFVCLFVFIICFPLSFPLLLLPFTTSQLPGPPARENFHLGKDLAAVKTMMLSAGFSRVFYHKTTMKLDIASVKGLACFFFSAFAFYFNSPFYAFPSSLAHLSYLSVFVSHLLLFNRRSQIVCQVSFSFLACCYFLFIFY